MIENIREYVNGVFAHYGGVKSVAELREDLLADLEERFRELTAEGIDDATAFRMTIDSIGDIEQTVREVAALSPATDPQASTNLSACDLPESDFAGVTAHRGKFSFSVLRGSDFSGADLTGSTFRSSDARNANFDGANLTGCTFSTTDLTGGSFRRSILVRANFSTMNMAGARFSDVALNGVSLVLSNLREATFERCSFRDVDFKYSDLQGVCLDGQVFSGVRFDGASLRNVTFREATLKNVSFRSRFAMTNRYYLAIKTICFDGARMDKLTYAALKSMKADLSQTVILEG